MNETVNFIHVIKYGVSMNYAKRVAKGGIIILLMTMLASVLGYLFRLFLARNLSVGDFGTFYAVLAFISFFWVIKDAGLGQALVKFIAELDAKNRVKDIQKLIVNSIILQLAIGFVIFIPLFMFSDTIALNFFHNINAKPIIQILSIEFLFVVIAMKYILQGFQKIKLFASLEVIRILLVFLMVLLVPVNVTNIALGWLVSSMVLQVVFLSYIFIFMKRKKKHRFVSSLKFNDVFKFGAIVFTSGIAGYIIGFTDTMLLTFYRTPQEVGLYQIALPTSQLLWSFVIALSAILFPVLSEMWATNNKKNMSTGIGILLKMSFIFMVPFALMMIAFPEIIISMLFGQKYVGAAFALQILSLGAIFYTVMIIYSNVLNAIGKPMLTMKIIIIVAIFNLLMNLMLVPFFGITGAAVTALFSYILGFALSACYSRVHIRVKLNWASLIKSFGIGIISLGIIFAVKGMLMADPIIEAAVSFVIAMTFYAGTIYFTILDSDDKSILKNIMPAR